MSHEKSQSDKNYRFLIDEIDIKIFSCFKIFLDDMIPSIKNLHFYLTQTFDDSLFYSI